MADNDSSQSNAKGSDAGDGEAEEIQASATSDQTHQQTHQDTDAKTEIETETDTDEAVQPAEGDQDPDEVQSGDETDALPDNLDDALVALAAATKVADTARDQSLRAVAEMENLRRRASRDVENAHKFALEKFIKALVPVVESLERAETALGDQAADSSADESADAVLEGVGLSLKLFKDTLEKQGVTQLDPHGEPFNPEHHEAIAMVPMPTMEPNSVIEVMRKGFLLNGRLIQAAQVVVSQGDAKASGKKIDEKA